MRDFRYGEEEKDIEVTDNITLPTQTTDSRNLRENKAPTNPMRRMQGDPCSDWKIIEVAIAYESSFCATYGGFVGAENKVSVVFELAKLKYELICVRLVMTHLEGYCNPNNDPYKNMVDLNSSGCGSFGMLQLFSDLWNSQRLSVHRDTAHLFSGTGLECNGGGCTLGCASVGTLCDLEAAYGINCKSSIVYCPYRQTF